MSRLDVTSFMVRDTNGDYDLDASIAKFSDEATTYVALHQNDKEKITEAMLGVFAGNSKLQLNVPALQSLVLDKVWDRNPASYSALALRIKEVLSGTDDTAGIREIRVTKGSNGGCRLRSESELEFFDAHQRDMTKEESDKAIAEAKAAAARK